MNAESYFLFLRFSLGFAPFSSLDEEWLKRADWIQLLDFANKQTLVGVFFEGIKKLPKAVAPQGPVLLKWIVAAQAVERQNQRLNYASAAVYKRIKSLGVDCCILKGQGNALLYANPFSRMPGDVDVWALTPSRRSLRTLAEKFVEGKGTLGLESYVHIELTIGGVAVELHPVPSVMHSPLHDPWLQRWFRKTAGEQCRNMVSLPDGAGSIAVPTMEFNVVFQLVHLYHHHLYEGIGLRQFVDYALLLRSGHLDNKQALASLFRKLGIYRFAGAVMYVLRAVFGFSEQDMIVPVNEKRGCLLMADILQGGNFGQHDHTFAHNALGHNIQRVWRDFRLVRYYPSETVSEPFFRIWHWFWRKTR